MGNSVFSINFNQKNVLLPTLPTQNILKYALLPQSFSPYYPSKIFNFRPRKTIEYY